jgi:hypothetical protein
MFVVHRMHILNAILKTRLPYAHPDPCFPSANDAVYSRGPETTQVAQALIAAR